MTMEIICPATTNGATRVPAVGRCLCKRALELERSVNQCSKCGRLWSRDGAPRAATNDNLTHPFLVCIDNTSEAFTREQIDYLLSHGYVSEWDHEPGCYVPVQSIHWIDIDRAMRKFPS